MKFPWYLREQGIVAAAFLAALSLAMSVFAQPPITVKGILLAQDGSVQGGARIIFTTSGSTQKMIEYPIAASGTFKVSLVSGMRYNVRVMAPGYPLQYFDIVSPDTTDDGPPPTPIFFSDGDSFTVHLTMRPKPMSPIYGVLRGTVYDSTGAPLPFARVTAMVPGRDVTAEVETDATGQFLCKAPAQPHYIACTWYPYPTQFWSSNGTTLSPVSQGMVMVSAIDTVRVTIKMVMNPQGSAPVDTASKFGRIFGHVWDQLRALPVSGATVFAMRRDSVSGPASFDPQTAVSPYSATTDGAGSYAIVNVPHGSYYILARAPGFAAQVYPYMDQPQQASAVSADTGSVGPIDFGLRASGAIANQFGGVSGKVLSKSNGQPLAAIVVSALLLDSASSPLINSGGFNPLYMYTPYSDTSKSDGSYSIKGMPRGTYIVFTKSTIFPTQYYFNTDSVKAAKRMLIDSVMVSHIDFTLRAGASISGKVVTKQGKTLSWVGVNANPAAGGFSVNTMTDTLGNFTLSGLSAGRYCINVTGPDYSPVMDTNQCKYTVTDGATLTGITLTVDQAGIIMGPYPAPIRQDSMNALNQMGFEIALFSDTLVSKDSMPYETRTVWANVFSTFSATTQRWQFVANQVPVGKWRLLLRGARQNVTPTSAPFIQTRGFSFGAAATFSGQAPVTITGGDTALLTVVNFPTGYSVFGRITLERAEKPIGCTVTAFVKEGSLFIPVSRSYPSTDSGFELPGLVDGLDYFIRIDAPNYPSQFWSPTESSVRPVNPWHFSTSSFVAAQVRAVQSPKGMVIAPPQLWAWFTVSDTGGIQLQCNTSASMPLDSIVLYGKVGSGATVALASFPYIPTQYTYTWKETGKVTPGTSLSYVFVGKGPALTLRSNSMYYFAADTVKIPADSVRLTLIPTRTGVQISWRQDSLASKTSIDTALLYRKADKDTGFVLYKKAWGMQKDFFDGSWDKTKDLGKSVYYQVQVVENNAVARKSAIVSFTATQTFINQMANVLSVGPSMKYGSIQQAIDAAQEFDIVAVEPGVYNENITLRGKVVTLQGNWTNGKAPVIGGVGGAAITAPYTSKSVDRDVISVNGFKIQNSLTGIASSAAININQCLFTGIQKEAVQLTVDSAAIAAAALADPLAQSYLNCSAWQCTFIGKGTGSMALRAYSSTAATPMDSFSQNKNANTAGGHIGASNCIFAYYASTYAPADAKGAGVAIDVQTCDFWQASKAPTSTQVMVGVNPQSIDPMFIDTVDYFLSDSSQLKIVSNVNGYYGYDGRRGYSGKNRDEPTIPAVANFKASITGQRQVTLSWSALPDTVKIDGYVVFRVLGYDSLFHVNSNSQWEPIISDTAMFSILDTFRTSSTVFIDNTPVLGVPYLYAVAGISATGNFGKVNLPYPPALSAYILKIDPPASIPWLAATAVGFSAVNLQWKKPLSAKSAAPAYTLCRITGGQNLVVADKDSSAVRTLVRQGAQSASQAQIFSTSDTSFYDSTTVVGPTYLYVVSVADSALAFGERPLAWAVVSLDSARYYPQRSINLAAGQWAMIGPWGMGAMPFSDTSSALFTWDDAKKSDKLYAQYATVNSMRSCSGYWINAGKDTVIGITDSMYGGVIRHRDSISVSLVKGQTGWNQIASPFPFATAPRWLGDTGFTVYAWKPDSSQYVEQSQLLPWQACWVHIDRDTQFVFRASDAVRPGVRVHKGKHMSQAAWELQISLSGKSNDPDNFIGIVAKSHAKIRLASLKPPQAFDYPQLYVIDSVGSTGDRAKSGQKLSKLYKISNASPQKKLEWMIGISPASSAMKVKIAGATSAPDNVYLFWVTASSAVNLKEQPEIDISAHKDPVYGYVVATTNLRDIGLYSNRVELRRSYPNPFRLSATLEFTIPYAWNADGSKKEGETRDLSLMLFNVNGQRISTLLSGKVGVGQHRLVWNGRTDAARPVAPGIIIARLSGSDFQKTIKMFKVR